MTDEPTMAGDLLTPAAVAELLTEVAESGGTAGAVTVVGSSDDPRRLGRRLVRIAAGGARQTRGTLGNAFLDVEAVRILDDAMDDLRARDGLRTVPLSAVPGEAGEGEKEDGADNAADEAGRGAGEGSSVELYLEIRRPVRELVVVGAGHIAQPMAHLGSLLGYRVTVLDDRPDFATRERFPDAHRLIRADFSDPFADVALHERSHLLLVTRGHKYDYECLIRALRTDPTPAYIGMIGSRRRVRATYVQLLEEGFDRSLIERIHAPVGLDIGAETPEEIAVAVAAELVMLDRGGTGAPLRDVERVAERFFQDSSSQDNSEEPPQ